MLAEAAAVVADEEKKREVVPDFNPGDGRNGMQRA